LAFVGFEIDEDYYTAANARLTAEMSQLWIDIAPHANRAEGLQCDFL
jgi:hypothetical protein